MLHLGHLYLGVAGQAQHLGLGGVGHISNFLERKIKFKVRKLHDHRVLFKGFNIKIVTAKIHQLKFIYFRSTYSLCAEMDPEKNLVWKSPVYRKNFAYHLAWIYS